MKKITFVTSNKGKVVSAQKYFEGTDIELEIYDHDLIEPRTDNITEIAESKVRQAYEIVKRPCIAQDSGFFIEELNGFPRAFVNFALDTIGIEGILKLMKDVDNRSCKFKECLAYYDGEKIEYFYAEQPGKLSDSIKGEDTAEKWSPLWYIFIGDYSLEGKTNTELSKEEMDEIYKRRTSSFIEFANWYKENKI